MPERWNAELLENCLIDLINGTTTKQNESGIGLPVTRIETIQKNSFDHNRIQHIEILDKVLIEKFKYKTGDIAFSHINSMEHVGKVAIYEGAPLVLIHGMNLLRLRFDNEKILPKFAYYYMLTNSFREEVRNRVGQAVNQVSINQKNLGKISIYYPSITEQQKIVIKLEALMDQINTYKTRLDKIPLLLKRFRQSLLSMALSGKLTEDWREDSEYCINTDLKFKIPVTWQALKLKKLASKFTYGTSQKSELKGDVPVLRMGNIQEGGIDWSNLKFTSTNSEILKYKLEEGDVLFNRTNSPELVGKTAIYKGERTAIFAGYLIKIKVNENLNPYYLTFCLNSQYAKEWCNQVKTDGVSQSNINAQKLAEFIVPTPSLEEQQEIVKRLNELYTLAYTIEDRYNRTKEMLDKLPQSILYKAFQGELVSKEEVVNNVEAITEELEILTHKIKKSTFPYSTIFPLVLEGVNTTDLHAGVLALTIQLHEKSEHADKLNHIKGEKISHLVEYHLGISLGRNPVKDAAGPDDYPHLKKVESRATKSGWFKIQKKDIGYTYHSNSSINTIIEKLKKNLSAEQFNSVQTLIQTFLAFNMVDAEVIATVHAGWNNLLLEGKNPKDEEIVYESRENWSKRKLEIDRQVFFGAINWIRKNGFEPKGKGKKIGKGKNKK